MAYSNNVVSIRDDLHNDGVEFEVLNLEVKELETHPSPATLRNAAQILTAVADRVLAPSRIPHQPKPRNHRRSQLSLSQF